MASRSVTDYKMYGQILRQPKELQRLLAEPAPAEAAAILAAAQRIFTVGTGTSYNAAEVAAYGFRQTGRDAAGWTAHHFALYRPVLRPSDVVIVFGHSGRKQFAPRVLAQLATAAIPTIWIAAIDAEPNPATVTLRTVAREPSSTFTLSHTAAMLIAARLADALSPGCVGDLAVVPDAVREALTLEPAVRDLAAAWHERPAIIAVGAGPHEPSAREVAIKINEAAWIRAYPYAAEEFLHGPQAAVSPQEAFICYSAPGSGLERTRVVAGFALDVGAPVAWVSAVDGPSGSRTLRLPDVGEWLAPIVQAVPGQLLAAHLATYRGVDADVFRRDDPRFQRAYARYAL